MKLIKNLIIPIIFISQTAGIFPWDYVFYNNNALEEYKKGNFKQSEKLFKLAESERPENISIKYNIANNLYKQNRMIESQSKYLEILENKTLNENLKKDIYYNLGNVLYRLGQKDSPEIYWESSVNNYQKALNISPNDSETRDNYKFVLDKLKKLKDKKKKNNSTPEDNSNKKNDHNKKNQSTNSNKQPNNPNKDNENEIQDYNEFVSNAETEKLLEEMKKMETQNLNLLDRSKSGLNTESSKNW